MKKKVTFMSFDLSNFMFPLTYEYLTGYALADHEIEAYWDFEYHADSYNIRPSKMESDMERMGADVYAITCYVWNMGLITKGICKYLRKHPEAHIILGGPQVARQGDKYLCAEYENLVLCNGEGERVFRSYLRELMRDTPDFSHVNGISFYRDNSMRTTPDDRIRSLDEIPSPYLNRLFNTEVRKYDFLYTALETNRGCPFSCNFCTWSILGAKPSMFSYERVKSDIERIAEQGFPGIFLLDANFGLFPRDVEIAKFVVECKEKYGAPQRFLFLSAYSNSERLAEIFKILNDAGIHQAGALSLQSMSPAALRAIGRKSFDRFEWFQKFLLDNDIGSYNDILWPLPGETLASLQEGIAELCEKAAGNFMIIPLVLLNNTGFQVQRGKYGIVATEAKDINHDAELVLETDEVSSQDRIRGWEFSFAATALHVFGGLYITARYLHNSGMEKYDGLFSKFADFAMSKPDMPFFNCVKTLVEENRMDIKYSYDTIVYDICHENRDVFDQRLLEFASSQPWWDDMPARVYVEADLLNRMYLYSDQVREKQCDFQALKVTDILPDSYIIEIPDAFAEPLGTLLGNKAEFSSNLVEVSHQRSQGKFDEIIPLKKRLENIRVSNVFTNDYLPMWRDYN